VPLTEDQQQEFDRNGYLILPSLFSAEEVALLQAQLPHLFSEDNPANIREKDGGAVRTAMGLHQRNPIFYKLSRHPRLVNPARQLLGSALYIQQSKVNVKAAFEGETWQWHYDFATHHRDDGVPRPLALNVHVFLDEVNEFNGPLYFVPGSHKHGPSDTFHDISSTSYPLWVVEEETVSRLVSDTGIVSATGPAGTVLIFGDLMIHGSPNNMSPWDRSIYSLILNPTTNAQTKFSRPEYKHHGDFTAVIPLSDSCLLDT
jgi:ectoine hydroxylase